MHQCIQHRVHRSKNALFSGEVLQSDVKAACFEFSPPELLAVAEQLLQNTSTLFS